MAFVLLLGGIALLYAGGEVLVAQAVRLARAFGLSPLVIGLTVVAFATSSPELFASVIAVLRGQPALSLGNILGSNVANLALILGLAALVRPLAGSTRFCWREIPVLVLAAGIPFVLLGDGELGRIEGAVLLFFLVGYIYFLLRATEESEIPGEVAERLDEPVRGWIGPAFGCLIGLGLLVAGAHVLVEGAVILARGFGVSERVIGLSIVAFGTSLPELAASLVAARRRQGDIVLGNVVGSNIFNVLAVLGITVLLRPIQAVRSELALELWLGLGLAVVLLPMLLVGRRLYLTRFEGSLLLTSYLLYVAYLFV